MRLLLSLLLGLVLSLPLSAGTTGQPSTLESVSYRGCKVIEEQGLCSVSLPGTTAPLRLKIIPGLADPKLVSLESATDEGYFLRHQNSRIKLHPYPENDRLFAWDATFYLIQNADGSVSFRSANYPEQYISVTAGKKLYISTDPEAPVRSFLLGN